eukprot:gene11975-8248_t
MARVSLTSLLFPTPIKTKEYNTNVHIPTSAAGYGSFFSISVLCLYRHMQLLDTGVMRILILSPFLMLYSTRYIDTNLTSYSLRCRIRIHGSLVMQATTSLPSPDVSTRATGPSPSVAPQEAHPPAPTPSPATAGQQRPPSTAPSAAQTMAINRRIHQLLELQVDEGVRDLASYMSESGLFGREDEGEPGVGPSSLSAPELRASLEHRMMETHKSFFADLKSLYETFEITSTMLDSVLDQCKELEKVLAPNAEALTEFMQLINATENQIHVVEEREVHVRAIWDQLNFKAEDQELLQQGPVDALFLEALDRARAVYTSSKEMMSGPSSTASSSRAYDVGISTYTAMVAAVRQLMAFLVTPVNKSITGGGQRQSDLSAASMSADTPELSNLYLRCIRVLYDYDLATWRTMVHMVGDMRRSSVLRRYCHLMATGSATTAAGTYRSGGKAQVWAPPQAGGRGAASLRPLEADLDKPLFFFRSLLAWMHQTIVAEMDLLSNFFFDMPSQQVLADTSSSTPLSSGAAASDVTMPLLLHNIFDNTTTHVETALQGVMERFITASCTLPPKRMGTGTSALTNASPTAALGRLTGGFRRMWRKNEDPFSPASIAELLGTKEHALQQFVTASRSQQEQLSEAFLHVPLAAAKELFDVLQLFEYYYTTTVRPLLGAESKLAELLVHTGTRKLSAAFNKVSHHIAGHLTRGVVIVVTFNSRLQQLQEEAALERTIRAKASASAPSLHVELQGENPTDNLFVTNFLLAYQRGDIDVNTQLFKANDRAYSFLDKAEANTHHQHNVAALAGIRPSKATEDPLLYAAAQELDKTLCQFVLPVSTELVCALQLIRQLLEELQRQRSLIAQVMEQQREENPLEELPTPEPMAVTSEELLLDFARTLLQEYPEEVQATTVLTQRLDPLCLNILLLNAAHAVAKALGGRYELAVRPDGETIRGMCERYLALIQQRLAAAAVRYYFPVALESSNGALTGAAAVEEQRLRRVLVLRQVKYFFFLAQRDHGIALPLQSAIEEEDAQRAVNHFVLEELLRRYEELFRGLEREAGPPPGVAASSGGAVVAAEQDELSLGLQQLQECAPDTLRQLLKES